MCCGCCCAPAWQEGYHKWKAGELKGAPLTPEDVARSALFIYQAPAHVCIREVLMAPTFQKS